jgi:hypothetical protein
MFFLVFHHCSKFFFVKLIHFNALDLLSFVLDHLALDVLCHLFVQPHLFPLCFKILYLSVPPDEPVQPGRHVGGNQLLAGVDVEGRQQPGVLLQ